MTTFRIISLADILSGKYCQHLEEPGRSWGRWRLNPDVLTLDLDDNRYEVDLEQCLTSAQVLDWTCQVAGKTWADDQTLAGLVRAIDDILHPQRHPLLVRHVEDDHTTRCERSRRPLRHRALRPRMHPPMGTGGAQ